MNVNQANKSFRRKLRKEGEETFPKDWPVKEKEKFKPFNFIKGLTREKRKLTQK